MHAPASETLRPWLRDPAGEGRRPTVGWLKASRRCGRLAFPPASTPATREEGRPRRAPPQWPLTLTGARYLFLGGGGRRAGGRAGRLPDLNLNKAVFTLARTNKPNGYANTHSLFTDISCLHLTYRYVHTSRQGDGLYGSHEDNKQQREGGGGTLVPRRIRLTILKRAEGTFNSTAPPLSSLRPKGGGVQRRLLGPSVLLTAEVQRMCSESGRKKYFNCHNSTPSLKNPRSYSFPKEQLEVVSTGEQLL